MIVTEKFIFIHLPKTGGTFVDTCLNEVYSNRFSTLSGKYKKLTKKYIHQKELCQDFMFEGNVMYGQHQGVEQIGFDTDLPIITVLRDPFDWYASLYNFAWWKTNPKSEAHIYSGKNIDSYPNLNFSECIEFYRLCAEYTSGFKIDFPVGYYTWYFISLYFKNPINVLRKINKEYIDSGDYLKDMYDVRFLWQGNLNSELYDMLQRFGFLEKDISFIKNRQRVLPNGIGRSENDDIHKRINEEDKIKIQELERLVFHFIENKLPEKRVN